MISYTSKITVRYYETDQMGVVHHSNYIRYFETGREEMMEHYGVPYVETERQGIIMPVHSVHCDYIFPAHYGEVLSVVTRLEEIPRSRITFLYEIYNPSEVLLSKGSVVLAFVDRSSGRPVRAPRFLTEVIEKLLNL
ncbi:MAG: thioesterase family protein [Bacteroidales bacterium]